MKNFNIIKKRKDSEELEKMSRVNILTREQYRECTRDGRMNKQMAQRLTDKNFKEMY